MAGIKSDEHDEIEYDEWTGPRIEKIKRKKDRIFFEGEAPPEKDKKTTRFRRESRNTKMSYAEED